MTPIGNFRIESGKMRVTDPCYDKSVQITGVLDVKPGVWYAFYETEDGRVKSLTVCHESIENRVGLAHFVPHLTIHPGVDSGQLGFFDDAKFPEDPGDYEEGTFYRRVCDVTSPAGIVVEDGVAVGVCSSSGYGDGGYDLETAEVGGKVVACRVDFMHEEDEEELYADLEDEEDGD